MTKSEIQQALTESHEQFLVYLEGMDGEAFEYSPNEVKWSGGQQLEHIFKSVQAVAKAFKYPGWLVKWKFGKANRPSRSYDELVKRYEEKLEKVKGRTAKGFAPTKTSVSNRAGLCAGTRNAIQSINRSVAKSSDQKLDTLILPHPLLGKVTLREMAMFCVYHVGFHHDSVKLIQENRNA